MGAAARQELPRQPPRRGPCRKQQAQGRAGCQARLGRRRQQADGHDARRPDHALPHAARHRLCQHQARRRRPRRGAGPDHQGHRGPPRGHPAERAREDSKRLPHGPHPGPHRHRRRRPRPRHRPHRPRRALWGPARHRDVHPPRGAHGARGAHRDVARHVRQEGHWDAVAHRARGGHQVREARRPPAPRDHGGVGGARGGPAAVCQRGAPPLLCPQGAAARGRGQGGGGPRQSSRRPVGVQGPPLQALAPDRGGRAADPAAGARRRAQGAELRAANQGCYAHRDGGSGGVGAGQGRDEDRQDRLRDRRHRRGGPRAQGGAVPRGHQGVWRE
mmetsp:Transcript_4735/g.10908  ORF Transcript_4735/g.10908 Transcript_4735/m.10908 type:complete len:331 (+) Transcript_4735:1154-2146(+)